MHKHYKRLEQPTPQPDDLRESRFRHLSIKESALFIGLPELHIPGLLHLAERKYEQFVAANHPDGDERLNVELCHFTDLATGEITYANVLYFYVKKDGKEYFFINDAEILTVDQWLDRANEYEVLPEWKYYTKDNQPGNDY